MITSQAISNIQASASSPSLWRFGVVVWLFVTLTACSAASGGQQSVSVYSSPRVADAAENIPQVNVSQVDTPQVNASRTAGRESSPNITTAVELPVVLDTTVQQGGLLRGQVPVGSEVLLNGKPVKVSAAGRFVLGFGRDAKPQQKVIIRLPNGVELRKSVSVIQRQYNIQRINGLPSKQVDMPADRLSRYQRELKQIKQARQVYRDDDGIFADLIWPARGEISGVFGSQRILNGKPKRPHSGLDIAASEGSPVVAPIDGQVTVVINNGVLIGNTVMIDHGQGVTSVMIHLHKIHVQQGQMVQQGDLIGEVGQTGRATGPHLHWGMNWFAERLDPQLLLPSE